MPYIVAIPALTILALIFIFFLFLFIKTLRFTPISYETKTLPKSPADLEATMRHLSESISIRTISNPDDSKVDWNEFTRFHEWLESTYPTTHKTLNREVVGRASLLYTWKGRDQNLSPFALLAHMDVVPVEESTMGDWEHPPFDGFTEADTVWGRGASDMKNHLTALFETIEALLNEGFEPMRDIYICIGHNEEVQVGEQSGARRMSSLLATRGVRLEFVLDEGGAVIEDTPFGIDSPAAMIGLAEKGYADIRVTVSDQGGHSAEPPQHTSLGKLSKVIAAIEDAPMKQRLISPVNLTLDALGRQMKFFMRMLFANMWLFKPLIMFALSTDRQTNAMTRTTMAATMAEAGTAANVLPQRSSAILNVRLLPGDATMDVRKHIERVVSANTDIPIEIEIIKDSNALVNNSKGRAYDAIVKCLSCLCEGVLPIPYLVTGATDSREYEPIADEIYRFYPFVLSTDELGSMHATNERIRGKSLQGALDFLYSFIREMGT